MTEWISVKDRLPEEDKDYLVFIEGRSDVFEFCSYKREYWWQNRHILYIRPVVHNVTHWAELPEPPHD